MATYEYVCLSCERPFEERRSMSSSVDTALSCPRCASDRVRRRFSLFAAGSASSTAPGGATGAPSGGCCGGGCACGG